MSARRRVEIGRIARPHGLTGEVVVSGVRLTPEEFAAIGTMVARARDGARRAAHDRRRRARSCTACWCASRAWTRQGRGRPPARPGARGRSGAPADARGRHGLPVPAPRPAGRAPVEGEALGRGRRTCVQPGRPRSSSCASRPGRASGRGSASSHEPGRARRGRPGEEGDHGPAPARAWKTCKPEAACGSIGGHHLPGACSRRSSTTAWSGWPASAAFSTSKSLTCASLPRIKHRTTDDAPVRRRGGHGHARRAHCSRPSRRSRPTRAVRHVVLLTPQGRPFRQDDARRLSAGLSHLVLLCGRYKGVDERVAERLVDEELSLGDFVLSGGEPAALCVVDAVARLLPGVLGDFDSAESDSFHSGLLDCAYYTRPATFRGASRSRTSCCRGITERSRAGGGRTRSCARYERRPDLLTGASLDEADRKFLRRAWPADRSLAAREAPKETS